MILQAVSGGVYPKKGRTGEAKERRNWKEGRGGKEENSRDRKLTKTKGKGKSRLF